MPAALRVASTPSVIGIRTVVLRLVIAPLVPASIESAAMEATSGISINTTTS